MNAFLSGIFSQPENTSVVDQEVLEILTNNVASNASKRAILLVEIGVNCGCMKSWVGDNSRVCRYVELMDSEDECLILKEV